MRRPTYPFFTVLGILCGCTLGHTVAWAQLPGSRANQAKDVSLPPTKDGVAIKITYYRSKLGQEAVPVVMLHDYKESRAVFGSLARSLQNPPQGGYPSYAIITVDLRGHGDSTRMVARNGQTRTLEADRLKSEDFRNMVLRDMEAVRKFLVQKNDAGELNLNKLCVLGSGMGASVATTYAAYDWSVPTLAQRKQGQDVKALILVSPKWSAHGFSMKKPLRQEGVREKLSVMIVYGEQDSRAAKDAKTIHKNLAKYHDEDIPRDQRRELQDLFLVPLRTRLQGTKLLTEPNFNMLGHLGAFLDARLSSQPYEWIPRKTSN